MKKFYFDLPLYKIVIINDHEEEKIDSLTHFLSYDGLIDGYNPELNENTSFKVDHQNYKSYFSIRDFIGKIERQLKCVRTGYTITTYFLLQEFEDDENEEINYKFQKIGQYPTIADLEIGKYKKYSKVISNEYLKELYKSIGLSSNWVGVGSFVYLRRIFETLVEKYHQKAIETDKWDEEKYKKSRIVDKIELLQSHLPKAIVKYKKTYSIISKGIHELTEQECLKYFPIVKDAIISMLEQDFLKMENETRQNELENNIKNIVNKLK